MARPPRADACTLLRRGVRQLLRRSTRRRCRTRACAAGATASCGRSLILVLLAARPSRLRADDPPLAIRITSPLGPHRPPARSHRRAGRARRPTRASRRVQLLRQRRAVGEDADGPPYAVEWTDENPFAPREITAEVDRRARATSARDVVLLKPLRDRRAGGGDRACCSRRPVQDKTGRFDRRHSAVGLHPSLEDGVPQALDLVRPESLPATYALLVDSSQSMRRRHRFRARRGCRAHAATCAAGSRHRRAVLADDRRRRPGPPTTPDDARTRIAAIRAERRHRDPRLPRRSVAADPRRRGPPRDRAASPTATTSTAGDAFDEVLATRAEERRDRLRRRHRRRRRHLDRRASALLKQLAAETGGRAFFPAREDRAAGPVHEQVASDVQTRYLLTYTPKNQTVDGTWRQITVSPRTDPPGRAHPAGLLRPEAAAGAADDRVHDGRREPAQLLERVRATTCSSSRTASSRRSRPSRRR